MAECNYFLENAHSFRFCPIVFTDSNLEKRIFPFSNVFSLAALVRRHRSYDLVLFFSLFVGTIEWIVSTADANTILSPKHAARCNECVGVLVWPNREHCDRSRCKTSLIVRHGPQFLDSLITVVLVCAPRLKIINSTINELQKNGSDDGRGGGGSGDDDKKRRNGK